MGLSTKLKSSAWSWIPSLYFSEGLPYIIVMFVATDMYKTMDISNASLAFWTSILYLPWVVKPLWSPYVDIFNTKRNWILWMQLSLSVIFFGVAISMQLPWWYPLSLAFLWILAVASATHDIAADGFYMLALNENKQTFFTGIRSTFYRLAMIAGMGALVILTGLILDRTGLETVEIPIRAIPAEQIQEFDLSDITIFKREDQIKIHIFPATIEVPLYEKNGPDSTLLMVRLSAPPAPEETIKVNIRHESGSKDIYLDGPSIFTFNSENWNEFQQSVIRVRHNLENPARASFSAKSGDVALSWTISISLLGILFLLLTIYHTFILPKPETIKSDQTPSGQNYWTILSGFFKKEGIVPSLLFLLFYRFAEAQLTKMASPFLLDSRENGGLALSLTEKGFAYGTVGLIALVAGGILGGIVASIHGLKKWMWWMALAINLPNLVYVYMAFAKPTNLLVINSCIAVEQFGYGFGFTGYMLYMLYLAGQGKNKTAHFALATGFMALGMMIPGMFSGSVQEYFGYQNFFVYIILCTIPSFLTLFFIKVDPAFGLKTSN